MTLLTELARHLEINLEQRGVRCVPHRHASIELFLKVARDFAIRWCVLADNDGQGKKDQSHAKSYAGSASLNDVLHVMPEDDIEGHLCASGFGSVYEGYLSSQTRSRVTTAKGDPKYWRQVLKAIKAPLVKPEAALQVVDEIRSGSVPIPRLLETAIRKAVEIAGEV